MVSKAPFVDKDKLDELCERYPTPFHLYDEAGIIRAVRELQEAFSWNAGFREYYAVKANPNPKVLEILYREGCGFDCATATELMLAEAVGATGKDIMFSSNDTPAGDYLRAARLSACVNFDAPEMVDYYLKAVGTLPETVSLRLNPGGGFEGTNAIFDTPGESKFGMTPRQLIDACRRLQELGVDSVGLHALLSGNTHGNAYYPALARLLFQEAVRLQEACGIRISLINLSGGIGIPYSLEDEPSDIATIGQGVRTAFEDVLVPQDMEDLSICTELGRYVTGPHGCLVTRACHLKSTYRNYVGVDACAADLMRPAMYGAYHHVTVIGRPGGPDKSHEDPTHTYDVVGGLCENNDKFAIGRALPEVEVGDVLLIHDTGAHGRSMGYNYNGKLRCGEVLLHADGSSELIRRAETPEDYFATLDVTDFAERIRAAQRRS